MEELDFRYWLINKNGFSKKSISDTISRLKRIESFYPYTNLDYEYQVDKCIKLSKLLSSKNSVFSNTPINKYHSTYRYALKLYVRYKDNKSS